MTKLQLFLLACFLLCASFLTFSRFSYSLETGGYLNRRTGDIIPFPDADEYLDSPDQEKKIKEMISGVEEKLKKLDTASKLDYAMKCVQIIDQKTAKQSMGFINRYVWKFRNNLVEFICSLTGEKESQLLFEQGLTYRDQYIRFLSAKTLGKSSNEKHRQILWELAGEKDFLVAFGAIQGLALQQEKEDADKYVALLRKKPPLFLYEAILDAAVNTKNAKLIPEWIKDLKAEKSDLRRDMLNVALTRMTGVNKKSDPKEWEAWLKENTEYKPQQILNSYMNPELFPSRRLKSFFKLEFEARNCVFVVDKSGSMGKDRKFQAAQIQLKESLDQFHTSEFFGVVFYSVNWSSLSKEPLRATEKNIKKAQNHIADMSPGGGTSLSTALYQTLAMASLEKQAALYAKGKAEDIVCVDSIAILCDEAACPQAVTGELVAGIQYYSRFHPIKVNIVTLKPCKLAKKICEELTKPTGGVYKLID